ncbi:hypothetical protein AUEXF2481DRAFT_34473 [Aureobasidium subglaciale EXF-2481]|uniref:Small EDRK-rich factor-like N-terminal domain-containing protein n=1 Tax=Aureobasidium subglaciale (strain EXF-2481) TaxID=1043005 RepID=A0A074YRG3_AURSE|nr:uncharacterized protein AUEXF2481DRAFT_34473 [Aureobasidium subglaciale EXF-2481]KER00276.1 hypothetical protein AUEXF2481DRAFT_34473 [Aureobasidium subglaciale EXF-2481]
MARGNQKERAREKTLKAAGNVVSFSQQGSTFSKGDRFADILPSSRKTRTTYDFFASVQS